MAADSANHGHRYRQDVEPQTRKLFKVCVMRDIPVPSSTRWVAHRAPICSLTIEKELGIGTYPMNWPIGSGIDFKGVYDREKSEIIAFEGDKELRGQHEVKAHEIDLNDTSLEGLLGENLYNTLRDDVELLDGAGYEFDLEKVRHGKLSPVFFGSALTNFGVEPFLESFLRMTTSPLPRETKDGTVDPFSKDFSAFVFKIQANMNKAHRDRIAFMRICSGRFERGMEVTHVQGGRKDQARAAAADDGAEPRDHRRGLRRRHHRRVRPRHFLDRRHDLHRQEGAV